MRKVTPIIVTAITTKPVIKMGGDSIRKTVAQENLAIMRDLMAEQ